ncbi:MAG TPA: hypothetical protein PLJ60_06770 [Chryseolinea sp.]|nr:hypothetical protein [Chryseolinea sp.]HPH45638.1 hypothetical protein [Chryseolinea sp.]HPM30021.1 hypothetical protein [Chryseolinea sp.]
MAANQSGSLRVNEDSLALVLSYSPHDTIVHRKFDKAKVDDLKNDDELTYTLDKATVSLWDRFWRWVRQAIGDLFYETGDADWGRFLVYTAMVVLLIYVIIRLLKIDALNIFYGRGAKSSIPYTILEENIHEMNFEKLIEDAKRNHDYRLAIRLIFLYSLKMLSDNQHIYWEPGKTNHDYLNEMKTKELKYGLRELNYYFEYTWYGNFTVNDSLFTTVNNTFSMWRTKI